MHDRQMDALHLLIEITLSIETAANQLRISVSHSSLYVSVPIRKSKLITFQHIFASKFVKMRLHAVTLFHFLFAYIQYTEGSTHQAADKLCQNLAGDSQWEAEVDSDGNPVACIQSFRRCFPSLFSAVTGSYECWYRLPLKTPTKTRR